MDENYTNCIVSLADEISKWGVGLIVGAGFSKAVINDGDNQAKNWKELFEDLARYLNISDFKDKKQPFIDVDEDLSKGLTLPQIATKVCQLLAKERNITYENSKNEVKKIIRALVNWVPESNETEEYKNLFEGLNIKWIVTTNYDEVLEAILGEKGYTIDPDQPLTAPSDMIPIYHIHGDRKNYSSLIVTHEDYVPLFKPGNYRESKLFTMMAEAPVLILGYSLSDLNLLSALEQSKQIFNDKDNFPVVLANFVGQQDDLEYQKERFDGGSYERIDVNSISTFLNKLGRLISYNEDMHNLMLTDKKDAYEPFQSLVKDVEKLSSDSESYEDYTDFIIENYSDLSECPEAYIIKDAKANFDNLKELGKPEADQTIIFNKSLVIVMQYYRGKSSENGNFKLYSSLLDFILYIIDTFEMDWFTPRGMELITRNLNYCLEHTGEAGILGVSWSADSTWKKEGPKFYKNHRELWDEIYLQAKIDNSMLQVVEHFDQVANEN
ncbi:SIR2 family protein [Companilactobacillus huachuanensis]|uniref:SIR2 family protein n=1 Tax=Companilactobacillus huachuanensis TaxID=2559914 RepID=A0ABW1RMX3_9LACO|nr:SIR2 family protein [Companilactobacillus huachuanensis]